MGRCCANKPDWDCDPPITVPNKWVRNFRAFERYAAALMMELGRDWQTTSFARNDGTAHRDGRALDIGLRSGPEFASLCAGDNVPLYDMPEFVDNVIEAVHALGPTDVVSIVLIEATHIHLQRNVGSRGRSPRTPRVQQFSPPVCNAIVCVAGRPKQLE